MSDEKPFNDDSLDDEEGDPNESEAVKAAKRRERLEQNRISARESRKRKKTMIEELQRTVITLSRENKELNERNEALRRELVEIGTKHPGVVPVQALMASGGAEGVGATGTTPNPIAGSDSPNPQGAGAASAPQAQAQAQQPAAAAAAAAAAGTTPTGVANPMAGMGGLNMQQMMQLQQAGMIPGMMGMAPGMMMMPGMMGMQGQQQGQDQQQMNQNDGSSGQAPK